MLEKELPQIKKNIFLKNYTTYKIGGPAKYFFIAENKEELIGAIKLTRKFNLPIFILGGGSNVLVSEKGFDGLVVKIKDTKYKIQDAKVFVGAGVELNKLAYAVSEVGLSGLEWAVGIPGATIGGAIFGHAQAFGEKISEIIKSVQVLDIETLEIKNFNKEQCKFSLKKSIFKNKKKFIIISATLELKEKSPKKIKDKIKKNLNYRKNNHPINFPSAGSTFVNPVRNKLPKEIGDLLANRISNGVNPEQIEIIPAGWLIEQCGLSGKKIGNAQISEKHANFIINLGGAKAEEVLELINLAKKEVKTKFKINLETEVQFIGF
jgi:UDP-N-acetylmuramate dehydrogenase